MGRTTKSKVLLDISFHSESFSLNAGIKSYSANIINCNGLLVKTNADFNIVSDSCNLSPQTTTHIDTSSAVVPDDFLCIKRFLLGRSYLLGKLAVRLSNIISTARIRHSRNNLYMDFIVMRFQTSRPDLDAYVIDDGIQSQRRFRILEVPSIWKLMSLKFVDVTVTPQLSNNGERHIYYITLKHVKRWKSFKTPQKIHLTSRVKYK